jgi:hypothetical protein
MSKASKSSASEHMELEGYQGHFEDFGPYTVGFETYTADAAMAPLFVGLPYAPPGHVPTLYAGTEVVEFSPTTELQKTLDVVSRNMEAGVGG